MTTDLPDAPLSAHILIPTGTLQNLFGGCICGEWDLGFPGIDDAAHAARRKSYEEHVERHTVTTPDPMPQIESILGIPSRFRIALDARDAKTEEARRSAAKKERDDWFNGYTADLPTTTTTDHYAEAEKHLNDAEEVHGDILKAQHRELARIHADLALAQALGMRGGL